MRKFPTVPARRRIRRLLARFPLAWELLGKVRVTLTEAGFVLSYPRDRELAAVLMAADQVEPLI